MRDRWTPSIAFIIALLLHVAVLLLISQQYLVSAAHPSRMNQAARRLKTINGRPVRFVYVKDMTPSKKPPEDPTRLSDMNRHGASPNKVKGTSPDPTSYGSSSIRQRGGPGAAPVTRPSVAPRRPSPRPSPGREAVKGSQGEKMARLVHPRPFKDKRFQKEQKRNTEKHSGAKGTELGTRGQPTNGRNGLPVGGSQSAGTPESSGAGQPSQKGRPPVRGLGTQLQKMLLGSLQGGFNNPIASRLNTGALSFDTAAWDLGPYARQVQERVQGNWHVPAAQMVLRQKGWVAIHFSILKDGHITDLRIVRPCDIPSYNQSALDALRSSDPLPPLPPQVTAPKLGGVFRFFYNMPADDNG